MAKEINIGFVGYSDDSKFDISEARNIIDVIFEDIENTYCTDEYKNTNINIITGGTNLGIPKMIYEKAQQENNKYGNWFSLIGVMAKEGYQYELYPCDIIFAIGDKFGDESKFFIEHLDVLYKIGGGKQAIEELKMAKDRKIPIAEYSL